jgi:hypothetical protein
VQTWLPTAIAVVGRFSRSITRDKRYDSIGSDPAPQRTGRAPTWDRRVTVDRAVWTKPLAFAADAVESAMAFRAWKTAGGQAEAHVVTPRSKRRGSAERR